MSEFHKCVINTDNECNCNHEKLILKRKDAEIKSQKKKCPICSKKIGMLGIECRCGESFCSKHRHPEDHNCSFDFKKHDRNVLKENSVGGGEFKKIDKI